MSCEFIFKPTYLYEAKVDSPGLLTAVSVNLRDSLYAKEIGSSR